MQSVNVVKNEESKRILVKDFISLVKENMFYTKEDFSKVYNFFSKLIELECLGYGISAECEMKALEQDNEFTGCEYSDIAGKEIKFFFAPTYFSKKYFQKEDVLERLDGVVELLMTIYREVNYAINLKDISTGVLSSKTLEISKELLLKEILGESFYKENNTLFSIERKAEEYGYNATLAVLNDLELLVRAKSIINERRNKSKEFSLSKIGKVKYMGETYNRETFLSIVCLSNLNEHFKYIYMFPIFEKIYNTNGMLKNIHELFDEMMQDLRRINYKNSLLNSNNINIQLLHKESFECKEFYYELIIDQLNSATSEDYKILAEKYGVLGLQEFLSGMEKYFNSKAQDRILCAEKYKGNEFETSDEIKTELKSNINSIIRFRNGVILNPIADTLLREGGFIRGTREILPRDVFKRREMFAESLISIYDIAESEEEYTKRAELEKTDIDEVVNALYYNRFENFLNNIELNDNKLLSFGKAEVIRTMQILKIAKILSKETNYDYFKEFLKIPDVNNLMQTIERDKIGYLNECMKKSQIRIKKVIYPATLAEEGQYREYILGLENSDAGVDIKRKITMLNEEFTEAKLEKMCL